MSNKVFQIIPSSSFNPETPVRTRGGRTKRVYRCKHCGRIFKRSEHCARHERVHTNERPFPCGFCDRKYARKDLVKRHERTLHAEAYRAAHPSEFRNNSFQTDDLMSLISMSKSQTESHLTTPQEETSPGGHLDESIDQKPPLTPRTENAQLESEIYSDFYLKNGTLMPSHSLGSNIHTDTQIRHPQEMSPSLGQYSPPESMNGPESAHFDGPSNDFFTACEPYLLLNPDFNHDQESIIRHNQGAHGEHQKNFTETQKHIQIDPLLSSNEQLVSPESPMSSLLQTFPDSFDFSSGHYHHYPIDFSMTGAPSGSQNAFSGTSNSTHALSGDYLDPLLSLDSEEIFALDQSEQPHHNLNISVQVQKDENTDFPKFNFNELIRKKICDDACNRMPTGELSESLFPSIDELQRFFSAYVECFHPHFPIIHLPSFELIETPSPLIFAICSVGAMYRLDRSKAKSLFALAGTMSSYALRAGLPISNGTPKPAPLWIIQTRVLLSLCGIFSEKSNVVMRTVENLGLFAIDYRLRRSLVAGIYDNGKLDWEDWISRESSKRLLCGMFIVSNLISTTFGINPGFSHIHDLEFEIPDEERLWNARSAEEWKEIRKAQTPVEYKSIRNATADLLYNGKREEDAKPYNISGFTMLVIMHAVNTHMWNLLQCTQTFNQQPIEASPLHRALVSEALSTLGKCNQIISSVRGREDPSITWHESEGPIMFNCQALLRIAYIRIVSTTGTFNRLTLLTDNPGDIALAVKRYVKAPQQRSLLLTKSVFKAFEGFLAPIRIGHLLVRKTAAQTWSVEHAVAGWDAALFLTKWVHTVETEVTERPTDHEERHILEQLKDLLTEVKNDYDGIGSLAAAVAHVWSTLFSDVWVWGVTPRMGNILQQLALAYDRDYQKKLVRLI